MTAPLKQTRIELNNAVFSLPDIVAKAEGYFLDEGVDVEPPSTEDDAPPAERPSDEP